jgi:hypothetical protein
LPRDWAGGWCDRVFCLTAPTCSRLQLEAASDATGCKLLGCFGVSQAPPASHDIPATHTASTRPSTPSTIESFNLHRVCPNLRHRSMHSFVPRFSTDGDPFTWYPAKPTFAGHKTLLDLKSSNSQSARSEALQAPASRSRTPTECVGTQGCTWLAACGST